MKKESVIYACSTDKRQLFEDFEDAVFNFLVSQGYDIDTCETNRDFSHPKITLIIFHPYKKKYLKGTFPVHGAVQGVDLFFRPALKFLRIDLTGV